MTCMLALLFLVLLGAITPCGAGAEMSVEQAWQTLPAYQPGQDMAALLTIDRAVTEAMGSPQTRAACAARLAALLADADTTPAARQAICLQLRQVGTAAEVPLLAKLLAEPETCEPARYALESIPGAEATAALRAALDSLQGPSLVGVIHSLAARRDVAAVAGLVRLADSPDPQVAVAAIRALGHIADEQAAAFLSARAEQAGRPTPQDLAVALLRCADAQRAAGKPAAARAVYQRLSQPGQPAGIRRAAWEGLLRLEGDQATATILAWFSAPDADRRRIAAGHLHTLPDEQLDQLLAQLPDLPDASKLAVLELAASRRGKQMLPMVLGLLQSDQPALQLAGVRCLGMAGDASVIPQLIELLAAGGERTEAAQDALVNLPRKEVTAALLAALTDRPAIRVPVIAVLVKLRCYDAIDPLVELASQPDPAVYEAALDGLRGIADPDKTDIPRLVKLLLRTAAGRHRDEVEKTIVLVCQKLPPGADRAELVLAALVRAPGSEAPKYLPLLGRLGGSQALAKIEKALAIDEPAVQEAAVRGLCNWPNADVAERLLELATSSPKRAFRLWALRAYIRVVTLPSERPAAETLALLQRAMQLADGLDEQRLALERAATIRLWETVTWIAPYLDEPALSQAACAALVELAHHRFLRQPNMDRFGPILDKVSQISQDPAVVERAKRYRLGL
jgi:HEAT repeat protein